ncbi:MAG: virulence factor MviN, partial [Cellulomonadaceae bacterium]|nr:virulence factor MviN [Cellulomonadaceae bacterium]
MNRRTGRLVQGLAGAAAMIALVNVASRIVGFVRYLVLASEVGPNALGTAYGTANTLPNVLFEVVAGGALAGAVVPLVAAPLARSMRGDVDRTASALLGWALAVLVPLAALVALFSHQIVAVIGEMVTLIGGTAGPVDVAGTLLATFALQIPLYGLGVVLTGVLQAQRRFLAAAMAPLLNSLVVIAVLLVFGRIVTQGRDDPEVIAHSAILLLGWGTTAGVAVMSLPLLLPVHRTGVRLRPTLRFPPGVAGQARALAFSGLGTLVAQQISVVVAMTLAIGHGGASAFPVWQYTQAVYFLPYAVLAYPLATATLPHLAERAAHDDRPGFARLAASTTRAVLLVSAAGAAALIAVAPAIQDVFAGIADGSVEGMAAALTWMAPGLLGFALVLHLTRALYALHRGRTAVVATASGWLAVAGAAVLAVTLTTGDTVDAVTTLRGLGLASSVGMLIAGAALVTGVVLAAGRAAVAGVARTTLVLVVGGLLGAVAGRVAADAVLSSGGHDGFV